MIQGAAMTFVLNQAGMNALCRSPGGSVGQAMTRLGNRVVNNAKGRANVDTGLMRSKIEFRLETDGRDLVGIVAARTNYSLYVHELYNPFLTDALADEINNLS